MVVTYSKMLTSSDGSCANINGVDWALLCDVGSYLVLRLFGMHSREEGSICLIPTPEMLALRESVLSGQCPPAVFADILDESRELWWGECKGSEVVLAKLREFW